MYEDFETGELVAAHTAYGWFPAKFFCLYNQPEINVDHRYVCLSPKGDYLVVDECEPFDLHFKRDDNGRIFSVHEA